MKPYRIVMLSLFVVLLRMPIACTAPEYIGGACDRTEDCFGAMNQQPVGSVCKQPMGKCECPLGQSVCCETPYWSGWCAATCPLDCDEPDAGTDSGVALCVQDSDCNEVAPSPECGAGKCIGGACVLVIDQGPAASQLYGDCKRRECNAGGNIVEVEDTSDIFNDGNECTIDYCDSSNRVNDVIPDAVPCPQSGEGYCYNGACVQCVQAIPAASCPGAGLVCDNFYCESFAQCNGGGCGGFCAPCGAGMSCSVANDCISKSCKSGLCALPSCSDGVKNNGETGIDCGGDACGPCPDGGGCHKPEECISGVCKLGECEPPSCFDQTKNGDEEQIDCGGPCSPCP